MKNETLFEDGLKPKKDPFFERFKMTENDHEMGNIFFCRDLADIVLREIKLSEKDLADLVK